MAHLINGEAQCALHDDLSVEKSEAYMSSVIFRPVAESILNLTGSRCEDLM